eukprot:6474209-Amphidinium_carterae.1
MRTSTVQNTTKVLEQRKDKNIGRLEIPKTVKTPTTPNKDGKKVGNNWEVYSLNPTTPIHPQHHDRDQQNAPAVSARY